MRSLQLLIRLDRALIHQSYCRNFWVKREGHGLKLDYFLYLFIFLQVLVYL